MHAQKLPEKAEFLLKNTLRSVHLIKGIRVIGILHYFRYWFLFCCCLTIYFTILIFICSTIIGPRMLFLLLAVLVWLKVFAICKWVLKKTFLHFSFSHIFLFSYLFRFFCFVSFVKILVTTLSFFGLFLILGACQRANLTQSVLFT